MTWFNSSDRKARLKRRCLIAPSPLTALPLADADLSSAQWHSLSKEEQAKYYEMARKERLVHSKLYPGWSARDNYVSAGASLVPVPLLWGSASTDGKLTEFFGSLFCCRVKRRRGRGPRVKLSMKVRAVWPVAFIWTQLSLCNINSNTIHVCSARPYHTSPLHNKVIFIMIY